MKDNYVIDCGSGEEQYKGMRKGEKKGEANKRKQKKAKERKKTLALIWVDCLKLLHPFIPFVTEEIWSMMPARSSGEPTKNKNLSGQPLRDATRSGAGGGGDHQDRAVGPPQGIGRHG